jgi:hypothetical protein
MWRITFLAVLVSLCSWLSRAAYAAGPGEPFPVGWICWILVLLLALLVLLLLGLLLRERKNRNP